MVNLDHSHCSSSRDNQESDSLLAITSLEASLGEDTRSPPSPLVPKLLPAQVENMVMMIMTQTPMGAIIMAFPHSALMTAVATSHVTTTYGTEMCLGTHLTKTSGLLLIQVLFSNFGIIKLTKIKAVVS